MSFSVPDQVLKDRTRMGTMRFPNEQEAYQMCCAITAALEKIYPGHLWRAAINQDLLFIQNCTVDDENAYCVHLADIDPDGKVLMRIAGEILERFGLTRGRARHQEIKNLEYDPISGNAKEI